MARRLTTNQEIHGSIPCTFIFFFSILPFHSVENRAIEYTILVHPDAFVIKEYIRSKILHL